VAPRKSTPKEEGGGDNRIEAQCASMQRDQYSLKPFKLQENYCGAKYFQFDAMTHENYSRPDLKHRNLLIDINITDKPSRTKNPCRIVLS
jgi:hypothetical protein